MSAILIENEITPARKRFSRIFSQIILCFLLFAETLLKFEFFRLEPFRQITQP